MLLGAAPAAARSVTVLIVEGEQPREVRTAGGVGLYVAGQGLRVSRQGVLERLDTLPQGPCGTLERCPIEIFLSVPPLQAQPNTRRYEVTILGAGYQGLLVSDRTRIPGLVAIRDIRETITALEEGGQPPIRWRASANALAELERLDRRLDAARRAQLPATVALALVLIALVAAALAARSTLLARTALLYPFAAIALAFAVSALDLVGSGTTTVAVVLAALPAAAIAARVSLTLAVPLLLGGYGLVLALAPDTHALMGIGPHPWSGGRFYGVTNQVQILLLPATLAAASLLRTPRLVALGALALVVVGASRTGADGGGLIVITSAFVSLWFLRRGRRLTLPRMGLGLAVTVAVALAVVALDAASGGQSHVLDAVEGGPRALLDAFRGRIERSLSIVTSTTTQFSAMLASVAILGVLAALRPRSAPVASMLIAIAVSLVVNDSPTHVAGFGAIGCGALYAWSARQRELADEASERPAA